MNPDWQAKKLNSEDVVNKIPDGSHVYIGNSAATAQATVSSMVSPQSRLVDIQIMQFLPGGQMPHLDQSIDRFRTSTFYVYTKTAGKVQQGIADYTPISYSGLPRLINEKRIPVDIAVIKVTPPNEDGFCSLGIGVDITHEMVKNATTVIAEITEYMPWTEGNSLIHIRDIDWWVEHDHPLMTHQELFPEYDSFVNPDILEKIGKQILSEISDGDTIKLDLTPTSSSILPYLSERKNIGLHTDVLTDQLLELIQNGIINNSQKNVNSFKTIVSHACGSQELYEFIHKNKDIEFHPASYINHVETIGRHKNMISIVGGFKVDLSGQVSHDSIGSLFFGGVGSADDSIRGSAYSEGGKPIIALPSTSLKGNSNIVFSLPQGTGVVITRADVHYIITEYGTAYLYGKPIRERCLSLIDIAHPNFRDQLLKDAKNNNYIHSQQPGHSFRSSYPKEWECLHETKKEKSVWIRPIKAVDEDRLRDFFHKLSDQNVYMRYFTQIRSLPQKVLKHLSDIDYSKNMTLVALSPPKTPHYEIVGIGQWVVDMHDNIPEIAFQIRDDWQGEGLGKYFFHRLVEISKAYDISVFKADVLVKNTSMNKVFENVGFEYKRHVDLGVYSYLFNLNSVKSDKDRVD
ncbi:MAG: 4-hydroxybutyrate CoA transferase [Desulfobacteraceae bacterium]|nr:4-hydroxybutyrate CoA transferase [Desulfobacteraceae bacterium]